MTNTPDTKLRLSRHEWTDYRWLKEVRFVVLDATTDDPGAGNPPPVYVAEPVPAGQEANQYDYDCTIDGVRLTRDELRQWAEAILQTLRDTE